MSDFVSQINAMSDEEFNRLEALLIWTTERQLRKARQEAAERGECIHGVELDTGEDWPCRECFLDEYPTQADFDARHDL